jgi:uncharacterized protein YjbI with pentapeptide repeats
MADRAYGAPAPPTETEIRYQDWSGKDLSRQRHTRVAFVEVDFSEVTNKGAVFSQCTFRHCRFNASTHTEAAFVNCTFTYCAFFNATFIGCKLVGSMFDGCTFDLLRCERGDWSFVGLPGADLRRARFGDLRMREADLTGTRCEGATIRRVDLSGAWLHQANFSGADLRGSDLSALDPLNAAIKGAVVDPEQALVIATALGLDVQADDDLWRT